MVIIITPFRKIKFMAHNPIYIRILTIAAYLHRDRDFISTLLAAATRLEGSNTANSGGP